MRAIRDVRGGVKKMVLLGLGAVGGGGGVEARLQFLAKKVPLFVFFYHSMQKLSKRVKHNKTYLCALPFLWLGLWLTLTVYFDLA